MDKCDRKERQMIAEGASAEEIASFQETSVGGVFQYVKGIMERFWAKIKAFFSKMYQKVKKYFANRVLDKANKSATKINTILTGDKYKEADNDSKMIAFSSAKTSLGSCAIGLITYDMFNPDDDREEVYKKVINKTLGLKLEDIKDFKKKFHEQCFNGKADTLLSVAWDEAKNANKYFKNMENTLKSTQKYVENAIKYFKKGSSYKDDSSDLKDMNTKISMVNSCISMISSAIFREVIFYVNELGRVVNKILSFKTTQKEKEKTNLSFAPKVDLY